MVNAQELTTLVTGTRKLIALSETGFKLFEFPSIISVYIHIHTYVIIDIQKDHVEMNMVCLMRVEIRKRYLEDHPR